MAGRKRNAAALAKMAARTEAAAKGGLRAVGYCRVSTDAQEEGAGFDYQRAEVERTAKAAGYALVAILEDTCSGASKPEGREGFAKVLAMAEAEEFDVLLVWRFDRLARSILGGVTAAQLLKERGAALRSCTENIDTTGPQGETVFAVMVGMASMEREAIARRTWEGRRKAAEAGKLPSGPAPYGYRRVAGGLEVVEAEAEVVRRIYKMERAGKGVRAIATALQGEGVPTRKGGAWSPWTVRAILENPLYRGTLDVLFGQGDLARSWAPGGQEVVRESQAPAILAPKARKAV